MLESAPKPALRQSLRARRRMLTRSEQRAAGLAAALRLARLPQWRHARHVGMYLPADGELGLPAALWASLRARGGRVYLPAVTARRQPLQFRPPGSVRTWQRNLFGLRQPGAGMGAQPVRKLDLVLVPLVAFDPCGTRLGMGGGFYDRTFARPARRPLLVGLAHDFQCCAKLKAERFDVPLAAVVTPERLWRCALTAPARPAASGRPDLP